MLLKVQKLKRQACVLLLAIVAKYGERYSLCKKELHNLDVPADDYSIHKINRCIPPLNYF